jgi:hypothetical protein
MIFSSANNNKPDYYYNIDIGDKIETLHQTIDSCASSTFSFHQSYDSV